MDHPQGSDSPIRVGVSACLLGQPVRYDGGHKADPFIIGTLGRYFCWVPVCPEMEIGLGTPREPIRLEGATTAPRLVATVSGRDHTASMQHFAAQRLSQLAEPGLHGYILKKNSPSCGMQGVRVCGSSGEKPRRRGRGLFAQALMTRWPWLPVVEEDCLRNPAQRQHFIERVYACQRWRGFLASSPTPRDLVQFHARNKLSLMAHSRPHYQALGRLVACCGEGLTADFLDAYGDLFMAGLQVRTTRKKHANVLSHIQGYLKRHLGKSDKAALTARIDDYRQGLAPLTVPLDLLRAHFRRYPCPYVEAQTYLNPYPDDLMRLLHG